MSNRQKVWRIGVVDGTDYATASGQGKCRVRLADKSPGILTKPFPVLFPFAGVDKSYFMPKIGDRVLVLTDENCDDGVVMGAIYSKQTQPPVNDSNKHHVAFDDGTTIEYDKGSSTLEINAAGDVTVNATGKVTITSAVEVTATAPSVTFNGTVQSNFNSSGGTTLTGSRIDLN